MFTSAKVAVFVHGCFWHGCPLHATQPKANSKWWAEKLARNVERDIDTRQQLESFGWSVVEVWEHEDPKKAAESIGKIVRRRSS